MFMIHGLAATTSCFTSTREVMWLSEPCTACTVLQEGLRPSFSMMGTEAQGGSGPGEPTLVVTSPALCAGLGRVFSP